MYKELQQEMWLNVEQQEWWVCEWQWSVGYFVTPVIEDTASNNSESHKIKSMSWKRNSRKK